MPILPDIKPWINKDYVEYKEELEQLYCNVNMEYFQDFYAKFDEMKHTEEPFASQDLYTVLDSVIQKILDASGAQQEASSVLASANAKFQADYLDKQS